MTKLAFLISKEEGFFQVGTLPCRNHNPGDLRHSPHSQHPGDPNAIGAIDDDMDGWADLERQLFLDSCKLVSLDPVTKMPVRAHFMTLRDAVYSWAPPSENDSAKYLADIINGFGGGVDGDAQLYRVLEISA